MLIHSLLKSRVITNLFDAILIGSHQIRVVLSDLFGQEVSKPAVNDLVLIAALFGDQIELDISLRVQLNC